VLQVIASGMHGDQKVMMNGTTTTGKEDMTGETTMRENQK
jgi:hypothetical protein